ncbi:MAG TPA: glycosyltransferase [Longimicrobium sp.]
MGSTEIGTAKVGPVHIARVGAPRVLVWMLRVDGDMYGGARSMLTFLEHQRGADVFVVVVTARPNGPAVQWLRRIGVRHEVLFRPELTPQRGGGALGRLLRTWRLLRCNLDAARIIRRERPDIVHADLEGCLQVAGAARLTGRRLVQHVRGYPRTLRWVHQLLLSVADRNVFVSTGLMQHFLHNVSTPLKRRVGRGAQRVFNGFPIREMRAFAAALPRDEARRQLGVGEDEIVVGVVASFLPDKGQRELLEQVAPRVARGNARVRFYFLGGAKDEQYLAECVEAAKAAGLEDRVRFMGFQHDNWRWFRAMDILAFPSIHEGFGRVVIEAQAFSVPVVSTRNEGSGDTLGDGGGGVKVRNAEEFADALLRLAADPALREQMGERGAAYAERFDVDAVTRDLEAVYASLC